MFAMMAAWLVLTAFPVRAALPLPLMLTGNDDSRTYTPVWSVTPPLPQPDGLRPCCAFGYNLRVKVLNIPVPFYQINNVVTVHRLGAHQYNDSLVAGLVTLAGFGSEHNGIIYTSRGGFIDTAHVRDSADMTVYLFTHLLPVLGHSFTLYPGDELAQRRIVFRAFTPPEIPGVRYRLAAQIAAHLAFQLAVWHEIAQWYGFESVPGFSEEVSAFSPEDLYSNLLGTRIALSLIRDGQVATEGMYNAAMTQALHQALIQLDAQPASVTRFQFDMLNGRWWNRHLRLPEKYLVLRRNYDVSDDRVPTTVPGEHTVPYRLRLPNFGLTSPPDKLAQLQLWPGGHHMARLPAPEGYYTAADFPGLAMSACRQDHPTDGCAILRGICFHHEIKSSSSSRKSQ
ncbi:DUF4056 domain-containing protein [Salmonella enterica subsp. enterica serovar Poona]|nr:DUF4056 domain-containing protein [Salmonella enterica subsp. enterica serovar Poona]HEB6949283.1 DUF4056 domain-containing protein [Salmonella enterica subsp. enterica serovar Hvittingfoss]